MNEDPSGIASADATRTGVGTAQAVALWRGGRQQEAQRLCETLAERDDPEALSLLAEICTVTGQLPIALDSLQRLARRRTGDASVLRRLGDALLAMGCSAQAAASYRGALAIEPRNARAHNNLGQSLLRLGQRTEAIACFEQSLELEPSYALAHNNLGIALYEQRDYPAAIKHYRRALELQPQFAEAYHNCANALLQDRRVEEALSHFDSALQLQPQSAETMIARGKALQQLKRFEEAFESYRGALRLMPGHAEASSDCASALLALQRPEEALQCCARAIALKPALAQAHSNHAGALRALHRYVAAEAACRESLRLKPDRAETWSNLANIMLALRRNAQAIEYCTRAIALEPALAEAHNQLAGALCLEKRYEEALDAYARVQALEPEYKFLASSIVGTRQACCDWREFSEARAALHRVVETGSNVVAPMIFLTVSEEPGLQLRCARRYAEDQLRLENRLTCPPMRYRHDRIRVAYLSADFHQHATAVLTAGLFEAHDREAFEIIAISFGPDDASPMRARLVQAFDRFIDIGGLSDEEAACLARSLEVDIAIDLKGFTGDMRAGILARRAAPIQVQYLGYPGTMVLEQIDYIIADEIVLPPEQQGYYSERVVWLPECYQVNDGRRAIAVQTPSRAEVGLPGGGFVFCCFNNNHKITPAVFDVWMRLLRELPGSVLWLLEDNGSAARNLRLEASRRSIDPARLVFAPRLPPEQHLARHRLADLFLDTLPYNAHTTSSDALWAGLPVLTCLGRTFAGRVAASLLHAVGLPELVAADLESYAALALQLATDNDRLAALRARLARNRTNCSLFDTARFCHYLEAAYKAMHMRHQQGLLPESFAVLARTPAADRTPQSE